MSLGRLRDHTPARTEERRKNWLLAVPAIARIRQTNRGSVSSLWSKALLVAAQAYADVDKICSNYNLRRREIYQSHFNDTFQMLSEDGCLSLFRFRRADITRMVDAISWPETSTRTHRNGYAVTPVLITCVLLRRMASPARWKDLELLFSKHTPQLSEIFREGVERLVTERAHSIRGNIEASFLDERALTYANAVADKSNAILKGIGFIDGTNIAIARPGKDNLQQRVAYSGHKRKHVLKFQAVTSPCGLALHLFGPVEGRRHDWTLYIQSSLEDRLPSITEIDGVQYVLYGDAGYNRPAFMEVPYQGSSLSASQRYFNNAMAKSRVTVEWYFREVKAYWTILDFKRKMRVIEGAIGTLYIAGCLLTNMRNCIYPNPISQYFKCAPPPLEKHLQHKDL